jgi:hypothetical protein
MFYWLSIALAVAALLVLVALVVRVLRGVRRLQAVAALVKAGVDDRTGLVRARSAALRVALDQRRASSST